MMLTVTWAGLAGVCASLLGGAVAHLIGETPFHSLLALIPALGVGVLVLVSIRVPRGRGQVALQLVLATVVLTILLPFGGYLGLGGSPGLYPWRTTFGLLLPAACTVTALAERTVAPNRDRVPRTDRRFGVALAISAFLGVVAAGVALPGGPERTLLGVSSAFVIHLLGCVATLHQDPRRARDLAVLLTRLGFVALTLGVSIVFVIS